MPGLEELETPSLLLDLERMKDNARWLANHLAANGVNLRLHAKTCKNIDIARICLEADNGPIAVATLAEAEYFASHGISDIIYAVGIVPQKLERALSLRRRGVNLKLLLDNAWTATRVSAFAKSQKHAFDLLLEIDCDGHRCGLPPDSPELLECAKILSREGQNLCGVLTHAGSAYEVQPSEAAFAGLAEQERSSIVLAAENLRAAGFPCGIVSAGSTPTAIFGENFEGVTEIRAGVFAFQDCVMAALGVCKTENIAISVLCRVIGKRASDGAIIIDAGWTALSSDRGLPKKFPAYGYGLVCDIAGNIIPHIRVWEQNQEHGVICPQVGYQAPELPIGSALRILPIHACATASCHDAYQVLDGGQIVDVWHRVHGW